VRWKDAPAAGGPRPSEVDGLGPAKLGPLLRHPRREVRDAAAAALARHKGSGRVVLAAALKAETDVRARLHALWGAARLPGPAARELVAAALADAAPEVRAEAARLLGRLLPAEPARREEGRLLALATKDPAPAVRLQAVLQLRTKGSLRAVLPLLADKDPFLAGAALEVLGKPGQADLLAGAARDKDAALRLGALLALRRAGEEGRALLPKFLADDSPEVRRAAIQWVGEGRLKEHQSLLRPAAARAPVTRELFEALLAATELLAGKVRGASDESAGAEYAARFLKDPDQPAAFRALALRMLRPDHPAVTVGLLNQFLAGGDKGLRAEAVRALALRADGPAQELLRRLAADTKADAALRAHAVLGLAQSAPASAATRRLLLSLLESPELRREALRSLRGVALSAGERRALFAWWDGLKVGPGEGRAELAEQLLFALGSDGAGDEKRRAALAAVAGKRPEGEAAWRKALAGRGDPEAGERVFFHARGPRCAQCHRLDGRGGAIGPDLSVIGRSQGRDKLVESVLAPSKEVAPAYTTWLITTRDGKVRTGVIVEEGPHSTVTLGEADGRLTVLKRLDIEERRASPTSLMPDDLHQLMTRREFLDLLAFLGERK
jgi:putative heme-binding domain-containing protein